MVRDSILISLVSNPRCHSLINAGSSMLAPWLHNSLGPRSGGVPSLMCLTLVLFLSLGLCQRDAARADPQIEPTLSDLEGTWEIQEEDKTYVATLDAHGNGPYTHEGGTFTTTTLEGRLWSGKWSQTGNDREGEFEVLLSEDGSTAKGRWWYTRVGAFTHIPARVHGGPYFFKRQSPKTDSQAQQP